MPKTETHFPQVPLEIVKKIVEEENGGEIDGETPEKFKRPTKKVTNGQPSAQADPEGENAMSFKPEYLPRMEERRVP